MLLQGSIRRFNLAAVLQFLAESNATGVLEVRDSEEYGFIYLVNGRVEGISLPVTDEKLGTRLLNAGCLSEQQLAEALLEDSILTHHERRRKPLGQRLVEKGLMTAAEIREVMRRQTLDQVFELAHWRDGVFTYEETAQMPRFEVKIQGDVQELLLDALRRIDEGEHARKSGNRAGDNACLACRLGGGCSTAERARYLRDGSCLWHDSGSDVNTDHLRVTQGPRTEAEYAGPSGTDPDYADPSCDQCLSLSRGAPRPMP